MNNFIKMNSVFFILLALLLIPAAAQASFSIACTCADADGDGYGNPASEYCDHPQLDCMDLPCEDLPVCTTDTCTSCGAPECASCAKCINPGATEICDGVDNNCDGVIDEEPAASADCDNGVFCDGAEICSAGSCQPGTDPCDDGSACTDDTCDEDLDTCENLCVATGWEDPCCEDPACSGNPICVKEPVCGDGFIDPGEICGEPGLDPCPEYAPICLDCVDCGIPVELLYFKALPGSGSVTLVWETVAEIDTAGFNILRSDSQDGPFAKINDVLIPGQGGPAQSAKYSYLDDELQNGATYWYQLEDVDVAGETYTYDEIQPVNLAQGMCSPASTLGDAAGAESSPVNSIVLFLAPIGVLLVLRRRRKN